MAPLPESYGQPVQTGSRCLPDSGIRTTGKGRHSGHNLSWTRIDGFAGRIRREEGGFPGEILV
jgi:hypothetical protein